MLPTSLSHKHPSPGPNVTALNNPRAEQPNYTCSSAVATREHCFSHQDMDVTETNSCSHKYKLATAELGHSTGAYSNIVTLNVLV